MSDSIDLELDPYEAGRALGEMVSIIQRLETELVQGFMDGFTDTGQDNPLVAVWEAPEERPSK